MALNRVITFQQYKEAERHLKTLGKEKELEGMQEEDDSPPPLLLKRKVTWSSIQVAKKVKVDVTKEKDKDQNPPRRKKVVKRIPPNNGWVSPPRNILDLTPLPKRNNNSPSPLKTDNPHSANKRPKLTFVSTQIAHRGNLFHQAFRVLTNVEETYWSSWSTFLSNCFRIVKR